MKYIVNKKYSSFDILFFIKNFEFKNLSIKFILSILFCNLISLSELNILFKFGVSFNFILYPLKI